MDVSMIMSWLAGLHPAVPMVLAGLGVLVVLGKVYVALTPSQADDQWYAKLEAVPFLGSLLKAVKAFAPIRRKDE